MSNKPGSFPHEVYDFNKTFPEYRENHLNALNELLSINHFKNKEHEYQIALQVSYYLFYISKPDDLKLTLQEITKAKLLPDDLSIIERKIDKLITGQNYNPIQITRIRSMVYSDLIYHIVFSDKLLSEYPDGMGVFDVIISDDKVITTRKTLNRKIEPRKNIDYSVQVLKQEKETPGRVLVGVHFLTGDADKSYSKLESWRKVAKHFGLNNFGGQFSTTSNKSESYNENDVFHTSEKEILDYCIQNKIQINCREYLKTK